MNLLKLFEQVVLSSIMGGVLALGILLIKAVFRQKLNVKFQYYVWFVLLLRLLIPYTPQSPLSVFNLIPQYQQKFDISYLAEQNPSNVTVSNQNNNITHNDTATGENAQSPVPKTKGFEFNYDTAALIWLIGVLGILLYILSINLLQFLKLRKNSLCKRQDIIEILEQCKLRLKVSSDVCVIYDTHIKSPALYGLKRPKILISQEIIDRLSPEELKYVFLHELSHLKRKDLLVNIVGMVIQAVYWFNPLIWFSIYKMKQDCEMACDATALSALNPEENKKYGQTIINMMQMISESHWIPGTVGFVSKFNVRRIIMISLFKKASVKWTIAALTLTLLAGCTSLAAPSSAGPANPTKVKTYTVEKQNTATVTPVSKDTTIANPTSTPVPEGSQTKAQSIVYENTKYGFKFTLPQSWSGYSIVTDKWEGLAIGGSEGEKIVETGPMLSIRHPLWTSQNPRQDIPIMIFTLAQWNSLKQEKFHIGAAPIGPSELGRNSKYVFALPARYNYAFPTGFQEVVNILNSKPLEPTENIG